MRKYLFLILLLFCLSGSNFAYTKEDYKVIKIIDGDTFYIDFNENNLPDSDEKVRVNGIDTFENKNNTALKWQMQNYNLTFDEALGLGYFAQEYAKKELLDKYIKVEYTANTKFDPNNRHLMSIYYDCKSDSISSCKSYEQEVLKEGLAKIYTKSNIAEQLQPFVDITRLEKYLSKTRKINLVVRNKNTGKLHKTTCDYAWASGDIELIKKPILSNKFAGCCYPKVKHKYKIYHTNPNPDVKDNNIELYFLNPLKQKKPTNTCNTNACKALLYYIDNAKESIDFAIYGIGSQDRIFNALVNAQARGVKIRWVTDLNENGNNLYSDTTNLMKKLQNYNTDFNSVESFNIPNYKYKFEIQDALMHNKFFIIDQKIVFTGSTNISASCLTGFNSNVVVVINSAQIAKLYEEEFNQMYNGHFHNDKTLIPNNENIILENQQISVYFSPKHTITTNKIIPIIKTAKSYIYVPAFYLTHKDIIHELIDAKNRGVEVKIIVDASSVEGKFVDINYMKNSGLEVKAETWNGKMHMKSIIIDDNILIIGSMNFTKQGERMNDENSLIIKNSPVLAKAYKKHFLKLWWSIK